MITKKVVQHMASLARIELAETEEAKLEKDLSAILEFIEKLNEVKTYDSEPMAGGTTLENIMRPDEQTDKNLEGKSAELIEAAPETKDGWVKVKAVFE